MTPSDDTVDGGDDTGRWRAAKIMDAVSGVCARGKEGQGQPPATPRWIKATRERQLGTAGRGAADGALSRGQGLRR